MRKKNQVKKSQRFIFMCNLLENLLSFDTLGNFICKFRCFEDNLCKVNSTPTSFGRWYMKLKSKICFQDLKFYFAKKNKIWSKKIFRETNMEHAENFYTNWYSSRNRCRISYYMKIYLKKIYTHKKRFVLVSFHFFQLENYMLLNKNWKVIIRRCQF